MANQEEFVEDLFEAALPLSDEERSRLLDRVCKDVPDVRRAVEILLTAHDEAGSFLSRPIVEGISSDESSMPESTPAARDSEDKGASLQCMARRRKSYGREDKSAAMYSAFRSLLK